MATELEELLGFLSSPSPQEFAQPALEALINLSQETALAEKMVEIGMIQKAMEILGRADSCIIQLLVMLLVNLTQLDSGGQHFLQIGDEKLHGLFVTKLVRLFSRSSIENEEKQVYSKEHTDKMSLELANPLSHKYEPEKDPKIQVQVVEAIYMIAMQEARRRALWSVNGTRILEVGYEDEEDPQVMEAYERLGSLLVHGSGLEEDAK